MNAIASYECHGSWLLNSFLYILQVFSNLFHLQLKEDLNEVIFALKNDAPIGDDQLSEARNILASSLDLEKQQWSQRIIDASKLIMRLRWHLEDNREYQCYTFQYGLKKI